MPINQQFDAISLCLVGLDCPASWDHGTGSVQLFMQAIDLERKFL
jgi:hypothetical protein